MTKKQLRLIVEDGRDDSGYFWKVPLSMGSKGHLPLAVLICLHFRSGYWQPGYNNRELIN